MGHNVQSQAGVSLSDVYDVKGGQAPIERILTSDVSAVHEMGATIQSERFSATVRRRTTGDLAQATAWQEILTDLPAGITRILGVTVFSDVASRSTLASVAVRDPVSEREIPIFMWDVSTDIQKRIRLQDNGAAVAEVRVLQQIEPTPTPLSFIVGTDQPQSMPDIVFRGNTSSFGAGTVEHVMLLHVALAAIGGISSRGLPIPSW